MMLRIYIGFVATSSLMASLTSVGQQSSKNGPLTPFSTVLRHRGIVTRDQVVAAVSNGDAYVRAIAAYKLAEDHDPIGAATIRRALKTEADIPTKIELATALWSWGEREGITFLETMCVAGKLSSDNVRSVATHLAFAGKGGACASRLVAILETSQTSAERLTTLPVLHEILHDASSKTIEQISHVAIAGTLDESPAVRIEAINLLSDIGTPASIAAERVALEKESDDAVRSTISDALSKLTREARTPISSAVIPYDPCTTGCPNTTTLSSVLTMSLARKIAVWKTGIGILTAMQVQPTSTNDITEQVTLVQNSCRVITSLTTPALATARSRWALVAKGSTVPRSGHTERLLGPAPFRAIR